MMNFTELKKLMKTIFIVTLVSVVALVGTILYGVNALAGERKITYQDNIAAAQQTSEMVKDVYPALVGIYVADNQGVGYGSGFLYKVEGNRAFVMTNAHVAVGVTEPVVYFSNRAKVEGKLLGKDENRDIAVIAIPTSALPEGYTTVNFGDSDKLQLGEPVVAIGNPIDPEFFGTTTTGVVSGVARLFKMETAQQKRTYFQEFIQIDAAINHGNSGGPLFNLAGQIIGMNSRGISSIEGEPVSNFGFSIPSRTLKVIVDDLERGKEPGIVIVGVVPTDSVGVSEESGVQEGRGDIERIDGMKLRKVQKGGAAESAGLQANDTIVKIDDEAVHSTRDFMRHIGNKKKGDKSTITYIRDKETKETTIQFVDVSL